MLTPYRKNHYGWGKNNYKANAGSEPGTTSNSQEKNNGIFVTNLFLRPADVTDGESKTAMFAEAVLGGCQAKGIHTAIETCGAASWSRVKRLADRSDLILYDLKLIDEELHRQWTGAGNRQILDNARRLAEGGYTVQIRVPLIPGVTDTAENLGRLFAFMCEVGLKRVALLPYNPSAGAKYEWLGRPYEIEAEPQDGECLAGMVAQAQAAGLETETP